MFQKAMLLMTGKGLIACGDDMIRVFDEEKLREMAGI